MPGAYFPIEHPTEPCPDRGLNVVNTPEDTIDRLHEIIAGLADDSRFGEAPYYRYGEKWFDTNEGLPPQVRWMPISLSLEQRAQLAVQEVTDPCQPLGSIATLVQVVRGKVWGKNESEVLAHFRLILLAIECMMGKDNPDGISQFGYIGVTGQWDQITDLNIHGRSITFEWTLRNNIPEHALPPVLPDEYDSQIVTPTGPASNEVIAVDKYELPED